jgi:hypothetical protein
MYQIVIRTSLNCFLAIVISSHTSTWTIDSKSDSTPGHGSCSTHLLKKQLPEESNTNIYITNIHFLTLHFKERLPMIKIKLNFGILSANILNVIDYLIFNWKSLSLVLWIIILKILNFQTFQHFFLGGGEEEEIIEIRLYIEYHIGRFLSRHSWDKITLLYKIF